MNFEEVDLTSIYSVGEYIMQRDYNLGIPFYNYDYGKSDSEDVEDAILECALKIMAYLMRTDNENEWENVNDLFQIYQGEPDNPDRYEDYEAAHDMWMQHEDELHEVEDAIKELSEKYARITA